MAGALFIAGGIQLIPVHFKPYAFLQRIGFLALLWVGILTLFYIPIGLDPSLKNGYHGIGFKLLWFAGVYWFGQWAVFKGSSDDKPIHGEVIVVGVLMGIFSIGISNIISKQLHASEETAFAKNNPDCIVLGNDLSHKYTAITKDKYAEYSEMKNVHIDKFGIMSRILTFPMDNHYYSFTITKKPRMISFYTEDTLHNSTETITFRMDNQIGYIKYTLSDSSGIKPVHDKNQAIKRLDEYLERSKTLAVI
jgi:hypothetical protein